MSEKENRPPRQRVVFQEPKPRGKPTREEAQKQMDEIQARKKKNK